MMESISMRRDVRGGGAISRDDNYYFHMYDIIWSCIEFDPEEVAMMGVVFKSLQSIKLLDMVRWAM